MGNKLGCEGDEFETSFSSEQPFLPDGRVIHAAGYGTLQLSGNLYPRIEDTSETMAAAGGQSNVDGSDFLPGVAYDIGTLVE